MNDRNTAKTPDLKFKYVNGLGDLVACILHSKLFGWLIYLITGKDKPCTTCSMRRSALNVLLHIPLWRFFFKNEKDLLENLGAEYRALGYKVEINEKNNKLSVSKATVTYGNRDNTNEN
jgi:hypothetical protein